MRIIKRIITIIAVCLALMVPSVATVNAQVDSNAKAAACEGLGETGSNCGGVQASNSINGVLKAAIQIFSWVVGFASVLMIIVGGFKYITSGGDSNGVSSAKRTVVYAVIGLVLAAMAQVLVRLVLTSTKTQ